MRMKIWKRITGGLLAMAVVLLCMPATAFAAAPIRKVEISLKDPVIGGTLDTNPTLPKGAKYSVSDYRWFESDTGEESATDWNAKDRARAGKYYGFQCIVEADENYVFADSVVVTINGVEAKAHPGPVESSLIVQRVYDPMFEPLVFKDSEDFDIPEGEAGTEIESFSVAGAVSGGEPPYSFELFEGPDWLEVAKDGTISGTRPDEEQVECSATIRVVDDGATAATIKIKIGHVNPKAEEPEESEGPETPKEGARKKSGVSSPLLIGALLLGGVGVVLVLVLALKRTRGAHSKSGRGRKR